MTPRDAHPELTGIHRPKATDPADTEPVRPESEPQPPETAETRSAAAQAAREALRAARAGRGTTREDTRRAAEPPAAGTDATPTPARAARRAVRHATSGAADSAGEALPQAGRDSRPPSPDTETARGEAQVARDAARRTEGLPGETDLRGKKPTAAGRDPQPISSAAPDSTRNDERAARQAVQAWLAAPDDARTGAGAGAGLGAGPARLGTWPTEPPSVEPDPAGPASVEPAFTEPAPDDPEPVRRAARSTSADLQVTWRAGRPAPSGPRPVGRGTQPTLADATDLHPARRGPQQPAPTGTGPGSGTGRSAATGPGSATGGSTSDRRRTFPPDPEATGPAVTWWGKAWVAALEDLSLDPARLARGRAYADAGHVDTITVTPGRVVAYVRGSRARPYRAELRLRTLAPEDWDTFLDAAAADPAHLESLLAKTVPQALLDPEFPLAEIPLLPATAGDLLPSCTCPDAGRPCKHAAALCYQVARIVDEDPFVVFLLRGRDEREVLDALGHRNAARTATESRTPPAVPALPAREALARPLGELPPAFPAPPHPGTPPSYPPSHLRSAPDPLTLDHLATDAAHRAHALLTTGTDPFAVLTPWQDAVRIAAAQPGSGLTASTRSLYTSLTRSLGRTPTELAKAVAAWRQGGPEALAVLDTPWDPPAGPFDRARSTLLVLGLNFRPTRNRLTAGRFQLRYGQDDALWYGYASETGTDDWWPEGPPGPDPVDVLNRLRGT
ncbi:hypothetical protein GCM10010329_10840 [Streptomyces spiroverticillatus]|uniref:SWIM-type domain-containing protein n=1 Tax=Streptomyces finlayi TaxID=67296 RepID=A0A918WXH9_9ACTN|nr:SWIM zinc finger family protein [Streptomyces finlayi]GGZ92103.1 hypothetical protein GCM10010329_10840 [Streptomyces spiroverticillatus]GHC93295.1 hypothetical protein GCM10010334_30250 [Streptomyces finlayi]